jgi:hypothetical protein
LFSTTFITYSQFIILQTNGRLPHFEVDMYMSANDEAFIARQNLNLSLRWKWVDEKLPVFPRDCAWRVDPKI